MTASEGPFRPPRQRRARSRRHWAWLAVLGVATGTWAPAARAVDATDLKAAIVYNLLGFVEWPAAAAPRDSLVLCVAPSSPLRATLAQLAGRPVRSARLEVLDLPAAEALARCHAVIADGAARTARPALLRQLEGRPVLVFDDHGAAENDVEGDRDGAAIHLHVREARVIFDIDMAQVRATGLQLSAKLMRLAREVRP